MLQVWCQKASMRMDPKWSLTIVSSFHELWDIFQQIIYYQIWETLPGCQPSCLITCYVLHSPAHFFIVHHKYYRRTRFVTLLRTLPTPHKTLVVGTTICFIREITHTHTNIYIYIYIRIHFKSQINSKVEVQIYTTSMSILTIDLHHWKLVLHHKKICKSIIRIRLFSHRCRMILRS